MKTLGRLPKNGPASPSMPLATRRDARPRVAAPVVGADEPPDVWRPMPGPA